MSAKLHESPDSKLSTTNYRKPLNRLFR
jgi:hypothetical protein